jgi:hypothetical protein
MLLVVWMEVENRSQNVRLQVPTEEPVYSDHFEAFETYKEALDKYLQLLNIERVYNASIAGVMRSTDYDSEDNEPLLWYQNGN